MPEYNRDSSDFKAWHSARPRLRSPGDTGDPPAPSYITKWLLWSHGNARVTGSSLARVLPAPARDRLPRSPGMYIKEITIDGFKSYAQRVVIPGFDPQFNAITGLNGSGKSNILDSICFVLGIQNLQQVRGPGWGERRGSGRQHGRIYA